MKTLVKAVTRRICRVITSCAILTVITLATVSNLNTSFTNKPLHQLSPLEETRLDSIQLLSLRETTTSSRRERSSTLLPYIEDEAIFAEGNIRYRVPRRTFKYLSSLGDSPGLIVGVLSVSGKREPRDWVRKSWAHNRSNVFFLIAGNWTDTIDKEFNTMNDLIWAETPEIYRSATAKVQTFLVAVHKHIPNYQGVLKTDNDVYARLHLIEQKAQENRDNGQASQYWGRCTNESIVHRDPTHKWHVPESVYAKDKYPWYALGMGYVISKDINSCVTKNMETTISIPNEDANVGIHVERCGGTCTREEGFFLIPRRDQMEISFMHHGIRTEKRMMDFHRKLCCLETPDPKSCGPVLHLCGKA